MLTDKEKEEISNLKPGFNIVKESSEPMVIAANRVEISRKWTKKLLNLSFWFNIVTIICFAIAAVMILIKPEPNYYASTPSGKIIGPLGKLHL